MSSALVRKSLAIVDPDFNPSADKKKSKPQKTTSVNIPEQHKLIEKIERGQKVDTINLLNSRKKLTVNELRKQQEDKNKTLKANLKKLRLLRKVCRIDLDKETTRQIFQRAVTKRPVRPKHKSKKSQKTVFTEEDFKRFEEDYFGE